MFRIIIEVLLFVGIVVCLGILFVQRDYSEPNYEFIPERQMARSPAFGTYSVNPNFADGLTLRQPPAHTIAQGSMPFPYGPDVVERVRAGKELKNPLSFGHPQAKQTGARLYETNCQFCHGQTGVGDGKISSHGFPLPKSFLKPPVLDFKDGEMFHIITHGNGGNMPAFAAQLTPAERWAVILHVRILQNKYTEFPNVSLDETKVVFTKNCSACHGADGRGSPLMRPKMPNLPDFSSMAWQFAKTNLEITNRIEYGDAPMMPTFRYLLSRDQILGLSIYLRTLAVKEGGATPATVVPAPPATAAGLKPVQIFRAYCLACHNVDGKGAIVRPGMPDIPDFTDPAWHGKKTDADLAKAILTGGKFMPAMKDKLAPADAENMAKFVRDFKGGQMVVKLETREVPKEVVPFPPKFTGTDKVAPPTTKPEPTSPEMAQRLRTAGVVFREYCIVCHGPDGTGAAAMRAALPPLPDFTKPAFQVQHSDPQLLISILDGKGTLMPANRGRVNEAQARDLVAFIRAFGPPGASGASSQPPSEFQKEYEQLQRQWEALEKEIRATKQPSP